jgi:hypothetical protein
LSFGNGGDGDRRMILRALEKGTLFLKLLIFLWYRGRRGGCCHFIYGVVSPFWCFGFVYGAAADRVRDPFFFASVSGRLALSLVFWDLKEWKFISKQAGGRLRFYLRTDRETHRLIIAKQFFLAVELWFFLLSLSLSLSLCEKKNTHAV